MDKYYQKKDKVNGYTILKLVGQGRYGIAYLAANETNDKFVIKQLKEDMLEKSRQKLFYEEKVLRSLDSNNIPKFIDKFTDEDRECYVLEYIEGKVFEDFVRKDRHEFTKDEIYKVCSQLLEIIEELHKNGVVHRDIRLPNVIIKPNKELALIDFGLARFINGNKRYVKEADYWYLADFLIHLYYTTYIVTEDEERPWFEELDLTNEERIFLKKLMGIEGGFESIDEIKAELQIIKNSN